MHTRSKPGTESQSLTLSIPATSFSQTELSIVVWIRYYCLKPARRARRKISQQSTLSPRKALGSRHSAKGSKRLPLAVHLLAIQSLFPTLSESQLLADSCLGGAHETSKPDSNVSLLSVNFSISFTRLYLFPFVSHFANPRKASQHKQRVCANGNLKQCGQDARAPRRSS